MVNSRCKSQQENTSNVKKQGNTTTPEMTSPTHGLPMKES